MKDLAVLIPVYNDQAGLDHTLDSIREADNSFTVVIVDDGSDLEITVDPERYPFPVELIRTEKNGGITRALNSGLEYIRSMGFVFLARLDAADLNVRNRLHEQYQFLQHSKDVYLLGSNTVFLGDDGRELFTTNLPQRPDQIRRWMVFRNCFIHPAVMLRMEGLTWENYYDESYPHIEDYVFFSEFVEKYRCENLGKPLVRCLVREEGISFKHHKEQLLSGLKYRWDHPQVFNPLWYAYLVKRLSYFWVPFQVRNRVKSLLGFVKAPALKTRDTDRLAKNSRVGISQSRPV